MGTVPLPPWLRRIQQSWLWQVIALPLLLGFGGSMLSMGCLANGIQNISHACLMGAINSTLISFATVVISGHSAGSASFNSDGTVNAAAAATRR